MRKHKNACKNCAVGGRVHCLAMPRRAVHPHCVFSAARGTPFIVILSGEIAARSGAISESKDLVLACGTTGLARSLHRGRIPAHDNAVVTEHLNILDRSPKKSSR